MAVPPWVCSVGGPPALAALALLLTSCQGPALDARGLPSARGGLATGLDSGGSDTSEGHTDETGETGEPLPSPLSNILLIVTDDIGVDKTSVYGLHAEAPPTPNIDSLAERGLLFRNAWSNPTCSPSRASILTGRQPSRTKVGTAIDPILDAHDLGDGEYTIPEVLALGRRQWTTGIVGKWHLVTFNRVNPAMSPLLQGFGTHRGSLANPVHSISGGLGASDYYSWEKNVDGTLSWVDTYMTTDTTNDAVAFLESAVEPWFLVVSYNSAHEPFHVPPDELSGGGIDESSADVDKYDAMVRATDAEIGRLLASLPDPDGTTILYMADNGTPRSSIREPWKTERCKGSVYEGGINVPLIVAGPVVEEPGRESAALVHLVDVWPTVVELAGMSADHLRVTEGPDMGDPVAIDGISLLPYLRDPDRASLRETVFTEGFRPNGPTAHDTHQRAVRDLEYKLIWSLDGGVEQVSFFHFEDGAVDEGTDLLARGDLSAEDQAAFERLTAAMDAQVAAFEEGW